MLPFPSLGSLALPWIHVLIKSSFYLRVGFLTLVTKVLAKTDIRRISLGDSPVLLKNPVPPQGEKVSEASAAPQLLRDHSGDNPRFRTESENHQTEGTS